MSTLLASGQEADVFALGDDRVLRRYRREADVTVEAEVMAYVGDLGYPVRARQLIRTPEEIGLLPDAAARVRGTR